jgi:hypothetical protein
MIIIKVNVMKICVSHLNVMFCVDFEDNRMKTMSTTNDNNARNVEDKNVKIEL